MGNPSEHPLYDDNQIQIKIGDNPEDHIIGIRKEEHKEYCFFYMQRGLLEHLALAKPKELENKLNNCIPFMTSRLESCGLTTKDVHIAILQAYIEDEKRIQAGVEVIKEEMGL
jgi:hypothetical protein